MTCAVLAGSVPISIRPFPADAKTVFQDCRFFPQVGPFSNPIFLKCSKKQSVMKIFRLVLFLHVVF